MSTTAAQQNTRTRTVTAFTVTCTILDAHQMLGKIKKINAVSEIWEHWKKSAVIFKKKVYV